MDAMDADHLAELSNKLGRRLASLRKAAGLTQDQVARATLVHRSYISHAECGRDLPRREFWEAADTLLLADGALLAAYDALNGIQKKRRERITPEVLRLINREDADPRHVPDQVNWAVREALTSLYDASEVDDVDRRDFLVVSGTVLTAFAHDWMLQPRSIAAAGVGRRVGHTDVDGLEQVATVRRHQHDALGGSRELLSAVGSDLRFAISLVKNGTFTDDVGRRLHAATAEFARITGNVGFEGARFGLSQRCYLAGLRAAHLSGNRALGANILAELGKHAREHERPRDAVRILQSALHGAPDLTPAVAARVHGQLAVAAARAGDAADANRAAGRSRELTAASDPAAEPPWIYWWSDGDALHLCAWTALNADRPDIAETLFEQAIAQIDAPVYRARNLALQATARLQLGELEGACGTAMEAFTLVGELEAGWVRTLLGDFRTALRPHATAAAATAYLTATADAPT